VVGGYGLLHLSGRAHLGQVELDVGIRNVFDRAYPELIAGHIVAPGEPRALFATTRYAF
jgi:outer membrane receptor for ferric coprogen and ferric-rhodotorulic acid